MLGMPTGSLNAVGLSALFCESTSTCSGLVESGDSRLFLSTKVAGCTTRKRNLENCLFQIISKPNVIHMFPQDEVATTYTLQDTGSL